jgi:hypothetical protein
MSIAFLRTTVEFCLPGVASIVDNVVDLAVFAFIRGKLATKTVTEMGKTPT